ncbi:MAG: ATP-binding protein [Spirulina sp. SIO3F2]|nr:ATP-binding protein [Spirulina sp. SIO3F2]
MSTSHLAVVPVKPLAQAYQAVERLRRQLQTPLAQQPYHYWAAFPWPSPFQHLAQQLGLTLFEQLLLLLGVGMELDLQMAQLYGQILGYERPSSPTFALALALFPQADWQALTTHSPLLRWQLLELAPHPTLVQAPLKLQPRILAVLLGSVEHNSDLTPWVQPVPSMPHPSELAPFYQPLVQAAIQSWDVTPAQVGPLLQRPMLQLCGGDALVKTRLGGAIGQACGGELWRWSAPTFPTNPTELAQVQQRWQCEALLNNHILLIECDRLSSLEQQAALTQFVEGLETPVILSSREPQHFEYRRSQVFEVKPLPYDQKHQLWQQYLGERAAQFKGALDPLIAQFNLNSSQIRAVCAAVSPGTDDLPGQLWNLCRQQSRSRLEQRAQRLHCRATWADLVLPSREQQVLEAVTMQVRQRAKVYQDWGFAEKGDRGLGLAVLFAGASGTGKTMAAEVLANELRLDLYRIDLSAVVSKYIGETEKNLAQIFDAAETGGVVLLFDEADALFGKRTEVKDSHDRHANIEVSYLLQRMEAFRGLAILTTNLKDSLDQAFVRRLRFIVNFPFPDRAARSRIWQRIFPAKTPTQGLDFELLGNLDVAGGSIRAIALNAAFMAADADEVVMMEHILAAAKLEYQKMGRLLSRPEVAGWLGEEY